ncbi:MAG: ParB N-terminal domain-containing protein [Planctomycetes bacterium]|nr:ParB N-terminal domain-containing protein [Planctomycetota bacterium]MCC7172273.1 ParB N-terminal domain-containing protein [Planctomycetota bacterium]
MSPSPKCPLAVEWVPLASVFPNPSNPRINDDAVPHVAASIRRFGWQQPLVVKLSGEIIAGHTRFKAAQKLGIDQVPVVRFTGTDLDAVAFGVADNRTHEFAKWDTPALAKLLRELRTEDALEGVGFSPDEIDALIAEVNAGGGAEGEGVNDPGTKGPPWVAVSPPENHGSRVRSSCPCDVLRPAACVSVVDHVLPKGRLFHDRRTARRHSGTALLSMPTPCLARIGQPRSSTHPAAWSYHPPHGRPPRRLGWPGADRAPRPTRSSRANRRRCAARCGTRIGSGTHHVGTHAGTDGGRPRAVLGARRARGRPDLWFHGIHALTPLRGRTVPTRSCLLGRRAADLASNDGG